ncbi:MAG TPA: putative maltokinase [Chthoniobacteraceae bacterium]|jgi:trehalose synthase-fused probable maltokinase|nr:putative maltokinase [Chthoniobacteraceae bacterium]
MDSISLSTPGANFFASPDAHAVLERDILPAYVPGCRWFGGKARNPQRFVVEDILRFSLEETTARLLLVRAEYASGEPETYLLPVLVGSREGADEFTVIATFGDGAALLDALEDRDRRADLLRLIRTEGKIAGEQGELFGIRGSVFDPGNTELEAKSRYLKVEQSNSSIAYAETVFLKLFRKPDNGLNPDVEITRFLSEKAHYGNIPPFYGAIEFHKPGGEPRVLGLAVGMVVNRGDAWAYALDEVSQYFSRVPRGDEHPAQAVADQNMGPCGERIAQLARRTAEVHLALASDSTDPVFAPEPIPADDQRALSEGVRHSAREMFDLLRRQTAEGELAELIAAVLEQESALDRLIGDIATREVQAAKTRTHGDYHLGQVLNTGDDFVIIDFEGEPRRTLAERQAKRSPLRDVAGMLRSFHYAAHGALERVDPLDRPEYEPWAELWSAAACRIFRETWLQTCAGAPFLPPTPEQVESLLNAFVLEKAVYEVIYELNHRPLWVAIPLRGVLGIVRPNPPAATEELTGFLE